METNKNRVVVTVVGKDRKGIIAAVSGALSDWEVNILDISQTIMDSYFAMIMLVDLSKAVKELGCIADECAELGKSIGMSIHIQHEAIFNAMHNV